MSTGIIFNGARPGAAAQVKAALGTSIKTQLQVKPTQGALYVAEWGIQIDAVVAFGTVELMEADVAATVTALAPYAYGTDPDGLIALLAPSGTSASGYAASAEGTVTAASRILDIAIMGPVTQYIKQFPLGKRPAIGKNLFGRVRTTMSAAVNGICWMVLDTEP